MFSELIRRANTIKLSRPEVWRSVTEQPVEEIISDVMYCHWYILGDMPPRYKLPVRAFVEKL